MSSAVRGRSTRRPAPTRVAAAAAAIVGALLAAGCGAGSAPADVATGASGADRAGEPRVLGHADVGATDEPEPSASTSAPRSTTSIRPSTSATTDPPADQASGTTRGSGGGPVTTVGAGGGADLAIYTGLLGRLGRDEPVADPIAEPPPVVPGTLPLTGLPGEVPSRPAAVVKIDNSSRARPQSGLNEADIVVEEEVEGGVTRLAAVFHSTSAVVGPVRSGRTTDIGIINGFGAPLLMYSGANSVTDDLLRAQPTVQNRSAATSSGYWRDRSRRAPSNLYTDTGPQWASAAGGPPPPQFHYRPAGSPVPGTPDGELTVGYRASRAAWTWDGSSWLRTQGGSAHLTATGERVSAANVVVIEAAHVPTGLVDSTGAPVPEFVFVGSGRATVFTAGHRIDGTWTRPTLASVATLTTGDGSVIGLTPGRTWIELIRADAGMLG